jgi:leader peptidase (prepilin peptidase) / N-methyltransferase
MTGILWVILIGIIGVLVGSALNTLIFRTKAEKGLKERSACMSCQNPIAKTDLIPVISFFNLRGRCRKCSAVIEWQYPFIEMLVGVLFALVFARAFYGFGIPDFVDASEWIWLFARDASMIIFLTIIFVYDFRYKVILDKYSVPAIFIALLFNIALGADIVAMLAGGLLLGAFFAIQFLISHGEWIGSGDIRLGILMGVLLGPLLGLVALFLAYAIGALAGIYLILRKHRKMSSHVPFGTFLSVAMLITMLWGQNLFDWYSGFFF